MNKEKGNNQDRPVTGDLTEFESGSTVGLEQFEDGSSTMLDEISLTMSGLLTEFEDPIEFVNLNEPGKTEEQSEPEEDTPGEEGPERETPEEPETEPEPSVEPDEVEEPGEGTEDDELIGDESEFIEPVDEDEIESVIDEVKGPDFEVEEKPPEDEVPLEPENPVICFVCEHALDISGIVDPNGWMVEHQMVRMIKIPCAGMVKGSWMQEALDKGASGVAVISCAVENCYHRSGAKILRERWDCEHEPFLPKSLDRDRIRLIRNYRAVGPLLIDNLQRFLHDLGRMDYSKNQAPEIPEPEIDFE